MIRTLLGVAAAAFVVGCASQSTEPAMSRDTAMGKVLADSKGMTLYTFDKDVAGKSNCNGQCAVNWPPLMASVDAKAMGPWSVVTRDDGSRQWAYKGLPVYGWVKDGKPGDTTGEGVNGVWRVAKP